MIEMLLGIGMDKKVAEGIGAVVQLALPLDNEQGRNKAMCVSADGRSIYMAGGYNFDYTVLLTSLQRYDIATNKWYRLATLPLTPGNATTMYGSLAQVGFKLYYMCNSVVLEYDIPTNTWVTKRALAANSPMNIYGSSAMVYNGLIYKFGYSGGDTTYALRLVGYDPKTDAVVYTSPKLPTTVVGTYLTGAIIDGYFYQTGGVAEFANSIPRLEIATNTWTQIPITMPDAKTFISSSMALGDKIYMFVTTGNIPLVFDTTNNTLESLPAMDFPTNWANQVVASRYKAYLIDATQLASYQLLEAPPPMPDTMLYLDSMTMEDTSNSGIVYEIAKSPNVDPNLTPLVYGLPSMRIPTKASKLDARGDSRIDLYTGDYTFEWSHYAPGPLDVQYVNLFAASTDLNTALGIYLRYEAGANGPLMLWDGYQSLGSTSAINKAAVIGKTTSYAMVIKARKVSVYVDGVRLIGEINITSSTTLNRINTYSLGRVVEVGLEGAVGNNGSLRISDYARYTGPTYDLVPY